MSILNMSKTLFKSLFHGPYTEAYPAKKKEYFEKTRGKIDIHIPDCVYCGLCQRRCPTGAIKVDKPNTSWSIERLSCIQCGYCVESCPKKCLSMNNQYTAPATGSVKDEYKDARVPDNQADH